MMHTPWSSDPWHRVLVYGLGLSGRAAAGLLLRRGVEVVAVDRRQREELNLAEIGTAPAFTVLAGGDDHPLPQGLDAVVVSPGVPPQRPLLQEARRQGLPILSEVELAYPFLAGPVVGITGTNGKSTTTELTGAMLRACGHEVEVCGNIGRPVSDRVEGEPGRIFVVELSSFQLENLHLFRPQAAALLNIAPDHLDRYASLQEYGAAKAELFAQQQAEDVAILHGDDPEIRRMVGGFHARRRFFSQQGAVEDGCRLRGHQVEEIVPGRAPSPLFAVADLPLAGSHNLENAMAAALLARHFDAEPEDLVRALRSFRGLPHRMERIADLRGVTFFDDSKGTNVAATLKSLEGLAAGTVHLILGGRLKGDDPALLGPLLRQKARGVYLIGEAAEPFAAALKGTAPLELSGTLEAAVAAAHQAAQPGDVVLLSPACASFDQFTDYAARGRRFQELVRSLEEEARGQEASV
jgi:UDP-N-acetylmuramoylalanine--D-glutamate ligase